MLALFRHNPLVTETPAPREDLHAQGCGSSSPLRCLFIFNGQGFRGFLVTPSRLHKFPGPGESLFADADPALSMSAHAMNMTSTEANA